MKIQIISQAIYDVATGADAARITEEIEQLNKTYNDAHGALDSFTATKRKNIKRAAANPAD